MRAHQLFYGVAAGGGETTQILCGKLLCRAHLTAHFAHHHFAHIDAFGVHSDVPGQLPMGADEYLLLLLVADKGIVDNNGISALEIK